MRPYDNRELAIATLRWPELETIPGLNGLKLPTIARWPCTEDLQRFAYMDRGRIREAGLGGARGLNETPRREEALIVSVR